MIQHLDSFEHRHHRAPVVMLRRTGNHGPHFTDKWRRMSKLGGQPLSYINNVSWHSIMEKHILKLMFAQTKSTYVHKHMLKYTIFNVWPKYVYFLAFHLCHMELTFYNTETKLHKSRVMCRPAWNRHALFTISVLIVVGNIGGKDLNLVKRVKRICAL